MAGGRRKLRRSIKLLRRCFWRGTRGCLLTHNKWSQTRTNLPVSWHATAFWNFTICTAILRMRRIIIVGQISQICKFLFMLVQAGRDRQRNAGNAFKRASQFAFFKGSTVSSGRFQVALPKFFSPHASSPYPRNRSEPDMKRWFHKAWGPPSFNLPQSAPPRFPSFLLTESFFLLDYLQKHVMQTSPLCTPPLRIFAFA